MTKVTPKPRARQGPPGKVVLRFGRHKGRALEELPVDYVAALRRFDGLFAETRKQINNYLGQLVRDPGQALMPFGAHDGEQLDELETSYLDWLLGEVELGPALGWLVKAELGRRETLVPVYDGSEEVVRDEDGWGHVLVHTRPKVVGHVRKLEEVEGKEPYDSRGFTPSEGMGGEPGKKPSTWGQRRPPGQIQAEEESLGQVWWNRRGQQLLWPEGLNLPPAGVSRERKDRNRVLWAKGQDGPVLRGGDDLDRVRLWDKALEALELLGGAADLDTLEDLYAEAVRMVEALAEEERWEDGGTGMLGQAEQAYRQPREALERNEVTFTDAPRRVEPSARRKERLAGEAEAARVHEVVRRMRSCRTVDDLLDVGLWVRLHREEFSEEAVAHLRQWFRRFVYDLRKEATP